jgi:hypothetical protein
LIGLSDAASASSTLCSIVFEKIGRQRDIERLLDTFEKARGLLAERRFDDGFEVEAGEGGGQRFEHYAVSDDFAVDEHAVAVTDEVVDHALKRKARGTRARQLQAHARRLKAS